MKLSISTYYNNEPNNLQVILGDLTLWFSYNTVIAFQDSGQSRKVRVNEWSTTTGKHLNFLEPNKKNRISGEEFEKLLKEVLSKRNIEV